jgi:hypothetical protein
MDKISWESVIVNHILVVPTIFYIYCLISFTTLIAVHLYYNAFTITTVAVGEFFFHLLVLWLFLSGSLSLFD